jgi:16S rRNA (adenine1518-N6/adenine1519-N6)-dimethyltransferase
MPPERPRAARKRFGQHFLERPWVDKVLRAIEPQASETFIEIGPGRGALTRPLTAAVERVVAFEIDRDLASELRVHAPPNLAIVEGDFLDLTADRVRNALTDGGGAPARVRVAGNLPYNVASPVLFKLIALYRDGIPLVDATVMLQREVADRLAAPPGSREYGILSVLVRHSADVRRLLSLPPGAFRPAPNVRSAVVRLQFHPDEPPARDQVAFEKLTQAIFTRRRKTLANALLAYPPSSGVQVAEILGRAALDGRRRPETLAIADLVRLADAFADARSGRSGTTDGPVRAV